MTKEQRSNYQFLFWSELILAAAGIAAFIHVAF